MRRIFRERYIGAVLIGFLLYNFVTEVIRSVENPIMMAIQRAIQHSAMAAGQPWYNKGQLLASLTDAVFYLVAALIIYFWLYAGEREPVAVVERSA